MFIWCILNTIFLSYGLHFQVPFLSVLHLSGVFNFFAHKTSRRFVKLLFFSKNYRIWPIVLVWMKEIMDFFEKKTKENQDHFVQYYTTVSSNCLVQFASLSALCKYINFWKSLIAVRWGLLKEMFFWRFEGLLNTHFLSSK